jgi:hypothetical protein
VPLVSLCDVKIQFIKHHTGDLRKKISATRNFFPVWLLPFCLPPTVSPASCPFVSLPLVFCLLPSPHFAF